MSVLTLRPNADSTPLEQYVNPVDAGHYTMVDEETLSESDMCQSLPTGTGIYIDKTDIYGFPNHTSESGTINSVKVLLKAKYAQVGADTYAVYIDPSVKIGSTVYNSGYQTLTTSTAEYSYTWTTNPATSSAWTWDEIDALLAGDKQTSHSLENLKKYRDIFCYQLWVEVDYGESGSPVKPHYYYLQQ